MSESPGDETGRFNLLEVETVIPVKQQVIAASPFCFGGFDPWVAYEYFQRAGLHYVEVPALPASLGAKHGITSFAPEAMDDTDVRVLRGRLLAMNLQPLTVAAMCRLIEPREAMALRRRIDFAHALGCSYVITDSCEEDEFEKHRSTLLDTLRRIGDYAGERGIRIALETHAGPTRNGKAAKQFLKEVAHPNIGYNYDTGNILYYNDDIDPAEDIREIAGQVLHVHLKDTQGGKGEWKFCALGDGRVNFKEIVRVLGANGFQGPYSLKIEGIQGEDLNREQNLQRLVQSLKYLRTAGIEAAAGFTA